MPDLRRQIVVFLGGTVDLDQFERWLIMSETDIEQRGSDEELDLFDGVMLVHAELTGDHVSDHQFIDAVRALAATYAVETELASAATG